MTKDWDAVQDEIRELSFVQKKSLEEVKELMERKHKFRASLVLPADTPSTVATLTRFRTRAYRMKLKEWGLMRHKPRRAGAAKHDGKETSTSPSQQDEEERSEEGSNAAIEPMSIDSTSEDTTPRASEACQPSSYKPQREALCDEHGRWRLAPEAELPEALPTFMGLLGQPRK